MCQVNDQNQLLQLVKTGEQCYEWSITVVGEWSIQNYPVMVTNINSSFMAWFPAISNNDHI